MYQNALKHLKFISRTEIEMQSRKKRLNYKFKKHEINQLQ